MDFWPGLQYLAWILPVECLKIQSESCTHSCHGSIAPSGMSSLRGWCCLVRLPMTFLHRLTAWHFWALQQLTSLEETSAQPQLDYVSPSVKICDVFSKRILPLNYDEKTRGAPRIRSVLCVRSLPDQIHKEVPTSDTGIFVELLMASVGSIVYLLGIPPFKLFQFLKIVFCRYVCF